MHKLIGLQALRAMAAIMVLIGHVIAEAEHYFGLPLPGDLIPWTRGVDIFFVISGFIITISASRFEGRPRAFLWRRLLRVLPLYYIFTTLMVITIIMVPGGAKDTTLDFNQILSSYGFIPYERADGRIAPVLSLGWTLNYEIFFYLLFSIALMRAHAVFCVSGAIVALSILGLVSTFEGAALTFWTNPIMIEFVFGIVLAKVWMRGWHKPDVKLSVLWTCIGFALLIFLDQTSLPRFIAAGLPALVIVAAATLFFPQIRFPGLPSWIILGDASYAIYLSHRFTLRAATLLLLPTLPHTLFGAAVYIGLVCSLAIALGLLTHHWIERPLLRSTASPKFTPVNA